MTNVKKRKSIGFMVQTRFAIIILFSTILMASTFVYIIQRIQLENAEYLLNTGTKIAWDQFYKKPDKLQEVLGKTRLSPSLQNVILEQKVNLLNNSVNELKESYPFVDFWIITDENASILCCSGKNFSGKQLFFPELVNYVKSTSKSLISTELIPVSYLDKEEFKAKINKQDVKDALITIVIAPIFKQDGKVIGTVTGCFVLNNDSEIPEECTKRIPNTYLSIAANNVRICSNIKTDELTLPVGSIQEKKLIQTISQKKQYLGKIKVHGIVALLAIDPIINFNGYVVGDIGVGAPINMFKFFAEANIWTIIWACIAVLLVAGSLAEALSKVIVRPISELEKFALNITNGTNKNNRMQWIDTRIPAEIHSLANTMIEMNATIKEKEKEAQSYINELAEERNKLEDTVRIRTKELVNYVEQLKLANEHKSQFLANINHELKTPLNAIIGFSKLLRDQINGTLNAKQLKYTEIIINSANQLLELIDEILDLVRIEQGKQKLMPETINISELIESTLLEIRHSIDEKQLLLNVSIEKDLPEPVWDYIKVKQVISNLLSNAIKFTSAGGSIELIAGIQNDNILFTIKDTGIGIKKADQERIFLAFEQADSSYTRRFHGTGLGLSISKKNVEMHHGKIWIESEFGVGTCVFVLLPVLPFINNDREV